MYASYFRWRESFDLVGTQPGTYQEVYRSDGHNPDLNEHLFVSNSLGEAFGKERALRYADKTAQFSCSGLEKIAQVNVKLLDHLLDAPVLPQTFYQSGRMCSICYEDFKQDDEVITTECHHIYHQSCGLSWALQILGAETCACCRYPINQLYFGTYDKSKENINASLIRVLTAAPWQFNMWAVSQFEYGQIKVSSTGTKWDCRRVILDLRIWEIVQRLGNGRVFFPTIPTPSNRYMHPMSPRQLAWDRSSRVKELVDARRRYKEWKNNVLNQVCAEFNSHSPKIAILVSLHMMGRNERRALERKYLAIPKEQVKELCRLLGQRPFLPLLRWLLLTSEADDVPSRVLPEPPRYDLRGRKSCLPPTNEECIRQDLHQGRIKR